MKLVQITDLHVAEEGEFTHGVDVRQNFLDILQAVKSCSPDLLVLSGDLCYDTANEQVYQWMKAQLDALPVPYAVISGNHDTPEVLAKNFNIEHLLTDGELYYKLPLGDHTLLFLETSIGTVSEGQLAWLAQELASMDRDAVIFMHHPPVPGGVPYMDVNYPLHNMAAVQEVFFKFPHQVSVFCGHYHVEKTMRVKNLTVHITPSTYFQIDWRGEAFQVDHYRPALREINLRPDGIVESRVVYYEGNKS